MTIEQPLKLSNGAIIFVEVDPHDLVERSVPAETLPPLEEVGIRDAAKTAATWVRDIATASFEQSGPILRGLAQDLHSVMAEAMADEAEVELGMTFKGGSNIKIARGTAECNLKVKLKWKYDRPTTSNPPTG